MRNVLTIEKPQIRKISEPTEISEQGVKPYLTLKRFADITLSLLVLFLTAPLMTILVALIKLESKGSALYLQERVGIYGDIFKVYKLRTMYTDYKDEGGGIRTDANDPRITRIGKLIRWCSIDEFPQFINILKGEMSFIGPRPISLEEHNLVLRDLEKENKPIPQGLIHKTKPGITGWAVLHGREKISYEDRFRLNAEYEHNISLLFDLKIFFLTFKKYSFSFICVISIFIGFAAYLTSHFI